MRRLNVITGPAAGQSVPVEEQVVIGREDADLTIPDPQLSRRHAAVRASARGIEIEDLGSTNGTFVDGERISEPVTLTTGATVRMGSSEIELEVRPEATRESATPTGESAAPGARGAEWTGAAVARVADDTLATPRTRSTLPARAGPPGVPAARRRRAPRRLLALLAAVVLLLIAGAVIAIVLIGGSDDSKARTFDAQIQALPLGEPSSVVVSGVLEGEPLGRVTVIIQRLLPIPPQRGGIPVPLEGIMLVFSPDGFMSLNVSGTLELTRGGAEIVDARGSATNGAGDFEDVKGSFTFTGGRSNPRSPYGRFEVFGTLEY